MARSLLDNADLAALRAAGADGPAAAVAAALIDSGLLQFDPDDPLWGDRDRVVVAGRELSAALDRRLREAGATTDQVLTSAAGGGQALALALGASMAGEIDGGGWRSWCVLDAEACDDGRVWEVASAARNAGPETLGAIVLGDASAAMWQACGWKVHRAPAAVPVEMLGGLDQLLVGPVGVLLVVGDE